MKRNELSPDHIATRQRLLQQAQGNTELALSDAVQSLHASLHEQDRLWVLVQEHRVEIQRLTLPGLFSHDHPASAEQIAERIYEAAARIVKMMESAKMQDDYEVTFNSMAEIASYGKSDVTGQRN